MTGTLTLALEADALHRLAAPGDAVADARTWSDNVGVLSIDGRDRAVVVADRVGVAPDFVASVSGQSDGLSVVERQYPAERHVLVGVEEAHRRAARDLGWEYLDVEAAADSADWRLGDEDDRWRATDGVDARPD